MCKRAGNRWARKEAALLLTPVVLLLRPSGDIDGGFSLCNSELINVDDIDGDACGECGGDTEGLAFLLLRPLLINIERLLVTGVGTAR